MKQLLIFILLTSSLAACNNSDRYEPKGLTKLSDEEIVERVKINALTSENIVFKDSWGNFINREDNQNVDVNDFYADFYVNAENEVVEVVVRKDAERARKLNQMLSNAFKQTEPLVMIDIDCSNVQAILEHAYDTDQGSRQEGSVDFEIDKKNQQIVASIIEKCGFPTTEEHGSKSVQAVFFVIQHAEKELREKYFPLIKKSADEGDLSWSIVALMEDRMLMDKGEKQIYGSQVQKTNGSDEWTIYPIEDPENVNVRRAEVGLDPIEYYLKNFDIEY